MGVFRGSRTGAAPPPQVRKHRPTRWIMISQQSRAFPWLPVFSNNNTTELSGEVFLSTSNMIKALAGWVLGDLQRSSRPLSWWGVGCLPPLQEPHSSSRSFGPRTSRFTPPQVEILNAPLHFVQAYIADPKLYCQHFSLQPWLFPFDHKHKHV